jgi:hypothetical protein
MNTTQTVTDAAALLSIASAEIDATNLTWLSRVSGDVPRDGTPCGSRLAVKLPVLTCSKAASLSFCQQ